MLTATQLPHCSVFLIKEKHRTTLSAVYLCQPAPALKIESAFWLSRITLSAGVLHLRKQDETLAYKFPGFTLKDILCFQYKMKEHGFTKDQFILNKLLGQRSGEHHCPSAFKMSFKMMDHFAFFRYKVGYGLHVEFLGSDMAVVLKWWQWNITYGNNSECFLSSTISSLINSCATRFLFTLMGTTP